MVFSFYIILSFYDSSVSYYTKNPSFLKSDSWRFINPLGLLGIVEFSLLNYFFNSQIDTCSPTTSPLLWDIKGQCEYTKWPEQEIISYTPEELECRLAEIPQWFRAFYSHTDEKVSLQLVLDQIFNLMKLKKVSFSDTYSIPAGTNSSLQPTYFDVVKTVADLGCCSGSLHLKIVKSFVSVLSALPAPPKVEYLGIDHDLFGIMRAWNAVTRGKSTNLKHTFFKLRLFNKDFFQKSYMSA